MEIFWSAFFGCLLAFLVLVLISEIFHLVEQKKAAKEDEDEFLDLMAEFDEMGYIPTAYCLEPEKVAQDYKQKIIDCFNKK